MSLDGRQYLDEPCNRAPRVVRRAVSPSVSLNPLVWNRAPILSGVGLVTIYWLYYLLNHFAYQLIFSLGPIKVLLLTICKVKHY